MIDPRTAQNIIDIEVEFWNLSENNYRFSNSFREKTIPLQWYGVGFMLKYDIESI